MNMWKAIKAYDSRDARRLWVKLDKYVSRIEDALERAKNTCAMSDVMKYNKVYLGTQARVSRIVSIRVFFGKEDRELLDEVVLRARTALKACRLMKTEDILGAEVFNGDYTEMDHSCPSSSDDDDDEVPFSPRPLSAGEDDMPEHDPVSENAWMNPEPPDPPESNGGGRVWTLETPPRLRKSEPSSPTAYEKSPSWASDLATPLPPSPPTTEWREEPRDEADADQSSEEKRLIGACAALASTPNPPEDSPDDPHLETMQVGTIKDLDEGMGKEGRDGKVRSDMEPSTNLAAELIKISLHNFDMEALRAHRPPEDRRFSGKEDDVEIEAFIGSFEMITDYLHIPKVIQFTELPHWFAGSALEICQQYDKEQDIEVALTRIKRHLKREFSRNRVPLALELDRLLDGGQVEKTDPEGFSNLIVKLDVLQRKAVNRDKPRAFGKLAIEQVLSKKLAFAAEPWLKVCSKRWADKMCENSEEDSFDDVDEEMTFKDFLPFLRGLQRRYHCEKRYKEERAVMIQRKRDEQVERAAAKKGQPKNWACPFCKEPYAFHLPEDCPTFKAWSVMERFKAVKSNHRCLNCLRLSHLLKNCTRSKCSKCLGNHHVLLHKPDPSKNL